MFLGYGGDKEFVVKSYVDASLTPIQIALSRDTGYVERGSHLRYDIKFCEIHRDLKIADPLTTTSLTSIT